MHMNLLAFCLNIISVNENWNTFTFLHLLNVNFQFPSHLLLHTFKVKSSQSITRECLTQDNDFLQQTNQGK